MARWEPGAEERLCRAALDLYLERGFDDVTVAEITERAGLTRRTFFRYFTDKREVLFGGAAQLPGIVTRAVREVDEGPAPFEVVLAALRSVGAVIVEHATRTRERRRVIAASPELQERERTKQAAIDSFKLVVIPVAALTTFSLLLVAVSLLVPLLALAVPRRVLAR